MTSPDRENLNKLKAQVLQVLCHNLLTDRNAAVRQEAAIVLGAIDIQQTKAISALCQAAQMDPDANVRRYAQLALARIYGNPVYLNQMTQLLQTMSDQPKVQMTFNAPVTGAAGNVEGDFNVNPLSPETAQELAQELDAVLEPLDADAADSTAPEAALQVLEKTPKLKQRLMAAITAGSITAIEEFCNHPLAKVALSALKAAFPNAGKPSETEE